MSIKNDAEGYLIELALALGFQMISDGGDVYRVTDEDLLKFAERIRPGVRGGFAECIRPGARGGRQEHFHSRFALRDKVTIDGDRQGKGIIGHVTALTWRATGEPIVEVSWFNGGEARSAYIDAWRLEPGP